MKPGQQFEVGKKIAQADFHEVKKKRAGKYEDFWIAVIGSIILALIFL